MDLSGRVALITGASRGIGRATAELLAERGATVVGTATSDGGVAAIEGYLAGRGRGARLEVTDDLAINQLTQSMVNEFGKIDILINNAGINRDTLLIRMDLSEWEEVLRVNLTAAFRLSTAVIGTMAKRRYGRIINIGSVVGTTGNIGQANYAAAKAGVIGFSKSLAREVARRGITVNVVAPGFIDTDMVRSLDEKNQQLILSRVPIGRLGDAKEVAYAVAFLASEQAGYMTGETLHVNGGLHMA